MASRRSRKTPRLSARALWRLEYALLRAIAAVLRTMPLERAADGIAWLWRTIAPRLPRHARALEHLAHAFPEKSEPERAAIARAMWANLGRVAAETLLLDRLTAGRTRYALADGARAVLERGRAGAVLTSLHSGNWEIVIEASNIAGLPSTGVYQKVRNPHIDAWLLSLRAPLYPGGLHTKGPEAARQMLGRLKRGEVVAVLADLRESSGIQVPFFGRPAYANPFPVMAARMTGVPLIAGRVRRLPESRFVIDVVEVPLPRTDDRRADVEAGTAALHAQFEAWIREAPEEWMWAHRKWKTKQSKRRADRARTGPAAGEPTAEEEHAS
jgi:KDO2-lipid IV(A) lauroyltransferase